jgi:hypothetical protein
MDDLDDLAADADSREAFVRFLDVLRANLRDERLELEPFLESLGAWLTDSGRFDRLDGDSWRAFAEMLLAARVYE